MVAKLASGNGSPALLLHEQRIIPECVQYARDLASINAMSGAANDAAASVNGTDAGICGNGVGGGMPRKHMARGIDMAMEREEMERGVDIGMETMESALLDRVDSDIREQLSATLHQDQLLHTFDGASVAAVHTHAGVDSISAEDASLRYLHAWSNSIQLSVLCLCFKCVPMTYVPRRVPSKGMLPVVEFPWVSDLCYIFVYIFVYTYT